MTAKQSLLEKIKDGSFALLTSDEISRKLRLGRRESYAVREILGSLCREGELLCDSRFRYGTAAQFGALRGTFTGNERGFGFFTAEDGRELFIPPRSTGGALHGDEVLACPVRGKSEDEGEVLAVLRRGMREVVGVYLKEGNAGRLIPDEHKFAAEIVIPAGKNGGCRNGEKAVARILSYREEPIGEIAEVLGKCGELFTEELALIRAHRLREKFPEEAEREALLPRPDDMAGRTNLRGELIITVDGEDTRDIDDAISVSEKDGHYLLGVHIADVSHYVPRGSALDREAFARGTSVYFPDRVLPMLPKALSNGICSLNEGEDRLTLSCLMTIDKKGRVLRRTISPSVIRSRHRMTYGQVTAIANGDRAACRAFPDLIGFVRTAVELTEILKAARRARGSVALDVKEAKILYVDGKIEIPNSERTISEEMIEQFMVLANESVASLMTERKAPFIYRVHKPPSEDKARDFARFLAESGIRANFDPLHVSPGDYLSLLERLEGTPLYPIVNRVMLRSMMKARYSPENSGHFGLASDCYCHFTSPIRRYPDLCVHRIIHEALVCPEHLNERYRTFVEEAAERSSACERSAMEAERDVDALYIVAYMQDKIGREYEATISGVTSFGLFAELGNTVEGFIPIETLPDDYYEYLEETHMLRGTRRSFRLGERVRIQVSAVDWGARRVHFLLIGTEQS